MILWTVMPMEAVFPQAYNPTYDEIEYAGTKMLVEKTSVDEYRVVRILSTNPQDYLRQDIQPGTVFRNDYFH
ncbi:YlzJ-like family protein [Sporomusa sp.]|uniref:YlzJ-like family protein n=1 Tax=Sporomusa sp. TaxID=2078658 RepID=UPI002C461550|nr:YlzJ-like family protein [Sporomusa sp.]HWR43095.1 YlzJ-like family protein [Sporomusa sp.]